MPVTPQICPAVLRNVAAELDARLGDSSSVFRGLGLSLQTINADSGFLVSYRQASSVLRRAMRLVSDSDFALHVGRRRSAVASGVAGLGFLASSSLHEAYRLVGHHSWAYGCPLHVRIQSGTDQVGADVGLVIEVTPRYPDPELEGFWAEEFFCSMTMLGRNLLGPSFSPSRLEMRSPSPAHALDLKTFLGCDIRFAQQAHRMFIDARCAAALPPSADRVVRRFAVEMLERLKVQPRRSDICETIEQQLREHIASPPTLAQLAASLNTSERTLRRKLEEQATSYQQLLDDVRKERALVLLRDRSMPITEVTALLGFTDMRNFRRAVKRWTGQSPTSIRKDE